MRPGCANPQALRAQISDAGSTPSSAVGLGLGGWLEAGTRQDREGWVGPEPRVTARPAAQDEDAPTIVREGASSHAAGAQAGARRHDGRAEPWFHPVSLDRTPASWRWSPGRDVLATEPASGDRNPGERPDHLQQDHEDDEQPRHGQDEARDQPLDVPE